MSAPEAWLGRPLTSIALCWKLIRADGVAMGFTSHDHDMRVGDLLCRARPGMVPSALRQSAGLEPDAMDIEGVLEDASIRGFDLEAGRWADARVTLLACDWTDAAAEPLVLLRGTLGQVSHAGSGGRGQFQVELRSGAHAIDEVSMPAISPTCRATLGDGRCAVDMAGRVARASVAWGGGAEIGLDAPLEGPDRFSGGRVRILDGRLAGLDMRIEEASETLLLLDDRLAAELEPGIRIELREGCDKRFATCRDRFANCAAFDGEPHVPGVDALIRYADP